MPRGFQVGQKLLAGGVDLAVLAGVHAGLFQVLLGEVEQFRLVLQHPGGDEVLRALLPQRLDVERAARGDVLQTRGQLRRARACVRAAPVRVTLLRGRELRAAGGAVFGVDELALGAVAKIRHRPEHLRDDLAGLAHHHRVADHHTLALDLVLVVQRGHGHCRAGDEHRLQHRERGRAARAADGDLDVEQLRGHLLRRVLVRDRPPRRARGRAQGALLGHGIHLDHQAVHLVDGVVSVLAPVVDRLDDLIGGLGPARVLADRQAPLGEFLVGLVLAFRGEALARADAVANHAELSLLDVLRVLLPQPTSRGVARVGKRLAAFLLAQLVELREVLGADEHLTADLQERRGVASELLRDVLDHTGVGGDVLAGCAVAAGGRAGQLAVFVNEVDGQPVDLQLRQVRAGRLREPLTHLVFIEDVVQAHHALGVGHVRERGVGSGCADLLRGRIRHRQLRVILLQLLKAAEQLVELAVGDHRLAVVVQVPVLTDLSGQLVPFTVQISGNFTHGKPV